MQECTTYHPRMRHYVDPDRPRYTLCGNEVHSLENVYPQMKLCKRCQGAKKNSSGWAKQFVKTFSFPQKCAKMTHGRDDG